MGGASQVSNVIALNGGPTPRAGDGNQTLIEELERLLQAARAGEVVGLAGAYVHGNKLVGYSFAGEVSGYALIGGLECVKQCLTRMALG